MQESVEVRDGGDKVVLAVEQYCRGVFKTLRVLGAVRVLWSSSESCRHMQLQVSAMIPSEQSSNFDRPPYRLWLLLCDINLILPKHCSCNGKP